MATTTPHVAIAHDYLTQRGGAERVVLALTRAFPDAPVYTTLFEPSTTYPEFGSVDVRSSKLNRVGLLRRDHRVALPLLAAASTHVEIDADVVICSSSGWSHGFSTTGKKIVYCYSPARWLYEPDRYLGGSSSWLARTVLRSLTPRLKRWDQASARTADSYLAISTVTQARIKKTYGIDADIVPAPHNMRPRAAEEPVTGSFLAPGYFLVVSRLLPYKNVSNIVRAFRLRPELRLVVVGTGPEKADLVREAGPNCTFLEGLSDEEMLQAYDGCLGLVAASHEDFGLTPLEAAARGRPTAALRWGGFLDTVVEDVTGVFFDSLDPAAIASAVDDVASREWDTDALIQRADDFSEHAFISRMRHEVRHVCSASSP